MISHADFGKLRLAHLLPRANIVELADWEFMGKTWLGEAVGFSEWLRLEKDPNVLRSLAIDFTDFGEAAAIQVLDTIGVPIRRGMILDEIRQLLGMEVNEYRFVKDRVSYEFLVDGPPAYTFLCTVLNQGGLTYLVVIVPV
jgi:hypothetical protein